MRSDQLAQHHLALDPGQVGAQAEVDPAPEGQVVGGVAGHVEGVRVGELARVAVARAEQEQGPPAGGDVGVAERRSPRWRFGTGPGSATVPERLLDRRGHQLRVLAHARVLVRVLGEGQQHRADQAGGGLVARQQQHEREPVELVRGEVPLVRRGDQAAQHVVAGLAAQPLELLLHVGVELDRGPEHLGAVAQRAQAPAQRKRLHELVRPLAEDREVRLRDAEHARDHQHRERRRQQAHPVGLAGRPAARRPPPPPAARPPAAGAPPRRG